MSPSNEPDVGAIPSPPAKRPEPQEIARFLAPVLMLERELAVTVLVPSLARITVGAFPEPQFIASTTEKEMAHLVPPDAALQNVESSAYAVPTLADAFPANG